MIYLGNGMYSDAGYLQHHGVKGMRWGVRKDPYLPHRHRRLKAYNLNKWGKSPDTNTLYVTGLSGSGKSTLAIDIAKKHNADTIHLDLYYEAKASKDKNASKGFNEYLKKHFKNYSKIPKSGTNDFGKWCTKFEKCVDGYSKELYKKRKKLIVEGIQIYNDSFMQNKSFYKDKPVITMKTNAVKSYASASARDSNDAKSLIKNLMNVERMGWYKRSNKRLNNFQYELNHSEIKILRR